MKVQFFIVCLLLLQTLTGCGAGDGSSLNANGQLPPEATGDKPSADPDDDVNKPIPPENDNSAATLSLLQETIFTPICSVCHSGANAPYGLQFDTLDNTAKNLINVQAIGNSEFLRVTPGNKENSFIYLKVMGDPRAGNRMPLNQPALSNESIAAIGQWIDNGANIEVNNASLFITSINQKNIQNTVEININFSVDVDKSTLTADQILIYQDKEPLSEPYELIWKSNRLVNIKIQKPTTPTALKLIINDNSLSSVMSTFGQQLDGNSDGQPGGAFNYETRF